MAEAAQGSLGETPESSKKLTVIGAAFLGVGSMVGAGIFALLGQAGAVAGAATWLSFLLAGVVASLLGYTVVKLGVRYPSRGGFVSYFVEAFGNGRLVGITSWLLFFVILIVTAMVAVSFGAYGSSLFFGDDAASYWDNILASLAVVGMAVVNQLGAGSVAKIQSLIVWVLLGVFAVFAVVTLADMDPSLLAPSGYPSVTKIVASVALTFFAYLGFSVIAFAAGDLPNPRRALPRAMALALLVTTAVYVAVSLGVFGTLTVPEVIEHGDTALAEAARPALGDAGFTIMAIAALLATASSINSNLFAAGGLTQTLAELTQFPPIFGQPGYFRGTRGVTVTAVLVLILANVFDLSAIASLGSAVSLVVFLVVGLAGLKLRAETGANAVVVSVTMLATGLVLVLFAIDTARNAPQTFTAMIVIGVLAVVLDAVWKRVRPTSVPAASDRPMTEATATSIDGSTFSFHAPVDGLELQPGSYASVGEHLGQVHTVELVAEERGSVHGQGMLLEGGVAPFHDVTIARADEARVAAWLEGTRPKRAGLDIGELTTEHGVRFLLDAGGFDRHTFFCGQSGSGKSYALGTVLEQLLLETSLRIVVLDPNSDFVSIGSLREGVDGDVANRYRSAAEGVVVRRGGSAGSERLHVRFTDFEAEEQAAVLRLDPIRDREEYGVLVDLVEQGLETSASSAGEIADRLLQASGPGAARARCPPPQPRHPPLADLVHRRRGLDPGSRRSGRAARPRCRPRLAGDSGGESDRRRERPGRPLAPPRRARSGPHRHRRGAQRLSPRARGRGHRPRDRARGADRGGRAEVRPLPARLDATASARQRARRLAVRQPRPHAHELGGRPRLPRGDDVVRARRARRPGGSVPARRGARRRQGGVASGLRPLRAADRRGGRRRRPVVLG